MYLIDDIQKTLRELGKITEQEVVKKEGDLYVAVNVLTGNSRMLMSEISLIESLNSGRRSRANKDILKGWVWK